MPRHERLVGHAVYFFNYSTWDGRVLYLEDLFVRKEFRSEEKAEDGCFVYWLRI